MTAASPTVLITGGTGFAGTHLIRHLLDAGYANIFATSLTNPGTLLQKESYLSVDLTNKAATREMMARVQPDWIVHLASFSFVAESFERADELLANNIGLQLSLLEAVRLEQPHARVLVIGSAEEYGIVPPDLERIDEQVGFNPVNPYAVSKVTQDLLAHSYHLSYGLSIIRARPFNHIGVGQTKAFAIPSFASQIVAIERGQQSSLRVGNLSGVRDLTSVQDMVAAYRVLLEKGVVGDVYNIGSGTGRTMQSIVDALCALATTPINVEHDPARMRPLDVPRLIADNRKMLSLGWSPQHSIDKELENILREWRSKQV